MREVGPTSRLGATLLGDERGGMNDERTIKELLDDVRQRVERRTFVQDVTEPLTGRIDQSKVAAKFNNLEHAVDELAEAVERVADEKTA
ncbi:MAG: hypothetical protein QOF71_2534 [Candidatus Eremiobacteraeota bacterium]|nr:hypothetical protein [Candidatus Eremiobacteraeota bacterium]